MSPDEPTPDPIDMSALGAPLDVLRFDAGVAAIMRASTRELQRRRAKPTLSLIVVQWRRPVLSFSGLAAAAALALFVVPQRSSSSTSLSVASAPASTLSDSASVAEWLGVPSAYASVVEGVSPAVAGSTP